MLGCPPKTLPRHWHIWSICARVHQNSMLNLWWTLVTFRFRVLRLIQKALKRLFDPWHTTISDSLPTLIRPRYQKIPRSNRKSLMWMDFHLNHPPNRKILGLHNKNGTKSGGVGSDRQRTIQFQDTPDAAKRPTTSRTVLTAPVYDGNPITFYDKLNQEFHYEYILKGHRLIHNDIIITLFQIFKVCVLWIQLMIATHVTPSQRWRGANRSLFRLDPSSGGKCREPYGTVTRGSSSGRTETIEIRSQPKFGNRFGSCR